MNNKHEKKRSRLEGRGILNLNHSIAGYSNSKLDDVSESATTQNSQQGTDSTPPPIVTGSQKRICSNVEFVYPRSYSRSKDAAMMPYVFDKQRRQSSSTQEEKSSETGISETGEQPVKAVMTENSSESIDEILFGSKTKRLREEGACSSTERGGHQAGTYTTLGESLLDERKKTKLSESASRAAEDHGSASTSGVDKSEGERGQLSGLSVDDAVRDRTGCRPRANSTDAELNLPCRGLCDERVVLESYKWKMTKRRMSPRGFINLGNTCFLNATLQCLAYLPPFSQCITSLSYGKNGIQPKSNGQRFTMMLSALFRRVHGIGADDGNRGAISPRAIVKALPTLGSGGSRTGYKFRPGRQEDAHEFLVHLLDAMNDGELKASGIDQQARGWRDRLPIPRLDETTFIHRIFGGYLRSQVRCTNCGYRSNTYDPFLDLSLEVSKKSSNSIASAFAEFTRQEKLDSENRWKCSECKKQICALKQLTVFRPPLALCIQLKRFSFGSGFGGMSAYGNRGWGYGLKGMAGRGSKITKPIDFPSDLKLPLSDGRKCEYGLTGIVVHVGGSASSGHYTAFIKKPVQPGQEQWYQVDDSFVDPVSEKSVLRHKDAYVLFYCRKEVKLEFPSPPPRAFMSAEEARESGAARARARADSNASEDRTWVTRFSANTGNATVTKKALFGQTELQGKTILSSATEIFKGDDRKTDKKETEIDDEGSFPGRKGLGSDVFEENCVSKSDTGSLEGSPSSSSNGPCSASDDAASQRDESHSSTPSSSLAKSNADDLTATAMKKLRESEVEGKTRGSTDEDQEKAVSSRTDETSFSSGQTKKHTNVEENGDTMTTQRFLETSQRPKQKGKVRSKTRVVLDQGSARVKLEVMVGPRFRGKAWKPKSMEKQKKEGILGTVHVAKWDDEEGGDGTEDESKQLQAAGREIALKEMQKEERTRKREMHLDRWDAILDFGKKKKLKRTSESPFQSATPKENPYQRIQSGIQSMNRGGAKGMFRKHKRKAWKPRGKMKRSQR